MADLEACVNPTGLYRATFTQQKRARACAHRSVNFGLRMANNEGIEAFCVGRDDPTCCVARIRSRRWLLSAVP